MNKLIVVSLIRQINILYMEIVSTVWRQLKGLRIRQREICYAVRSGLIWVRLAW